METTQIETNQKRKVIDTLRGAIEKKTDWINVNETEIEGGMPQMEVTHNTSHEPIFTDDQLM
ncbi:hypothetical protein Tcan_07159 [Toxocara canis]|uniref:Uncharacterized protein n=1 Tax=Toxocara canis TaxID=6265 RepID=A0A0B2VAZ1_TOXCA|nr:hypothetical protein Tcan_07159 [Toxocara canis]